MIARLLHGVNFVTAAILFLTFSSFTSFALAPGSLTLAWDPSSDPSVVGYRLYQGFTSEQFTNVFDVGSNLQATVSGLVPGGTYFFAVTAYGDTGLESAFSGTVSYTVPTSAPHPAAPAHLVIFSIDPDQVVVGGTGSAGYVYDICASLDLRSWVVIGSVTVDATGWFHFTDQLGSGDPRRFYRLRPHSR